MAPFFVINIFVGEEKWLMVPSNPARLVDPPSVQHRAIQPLTSEQAKAFLEAVRGDRLEALYTVALALGLRRGEALGLRWNDLDVQRGTLTIRSSLQRVGGKLELLDVKTEQSRRTVKLPKVAVMALKAHRVVQEGDKALAGERWVDSSHIFTSAVGTPIDPRNLNRRFDKALEKAGVHRIRFHDLRHSAATLLMAQGVPIKMISELLGHSTSRMTLEIYSHVMEPMRQEAADQMDQLLSS